MPYDSGPGNGNTSLEYGSGGKKIAIVPPCAGEVEGTSMYYEDAVEGYLTGDDDEPAEGDTAQ